MMNEGLSREDELEEAIGRRGVRRGRGKERKKRSGRRDGWEGRDR
jgi:hypothetical protein